MIAADGAHSLVRHRLDIGFYGQDLRADVPPRRPPSRFRLGRRRIPHLRVGRGAGRALSDGQRPRAADRGPATLHRNSDSRYGPTLDDCRAIVERRVHHRVTLSSIGWSSYFRLNSRMVDRLRVERIFLAGDAAHVHSPAGAQGMNTGIQEALNLGWKIARMLSGGASDRLLDTYHAERHPIERDVLRQSSMLTQMDERRTRSDEADPRSRDARALRDRPAARRDAAHGERAVDSVPAQSADDGASARWRSARGRARAGCAGACGRRAPRARAGFRLPVRPARSRRTFRSSCWWNPEGADDIALAPATITVAHAMRDPTERIERSDGKWCCPRGAHVAYHRCHAG